MRLSAEDQRHVDAYLEYDALVGATDGGVLLTPKAYEALRETAASSDALLCFWVCVPTGLRCRAVGPFSRCLCSHTFREHRVFQQRQPAHAPPRGRQEQSQQQQALPQPVKCLVPGCSCPHYSFLPIQGSGDLRCRCKHSYRDHHAVTRRCLKCHPPARAAPSKKAPPASAGTTARNRSQKCVVFDSPTTCSCGSAYAVHETRFSFASEGGPLAKAATTQRTAVPMGGLTGTHELRSEGAGARFF
ncbi:protein FAM221A [Cyclospora cayetanensis]|uniref:Protein FAM221A n=1 Tax=Cyclospora cayetanensis TaxID=88456 RepID=A0A6P6RX60_9EIME|nr:protein FAM221A [Cyclospora cayetanensis]